MITVVIPAHNEESVIGRCLSNLTKGESSEELSIIVVCNGCSDKTADVAAQFEGVSVVDIKTASKIAALNEGDKYIGEFPVAYVDADIKVNASDIVCAAKQLSAAIKIVAPASVIRTDHSNIFVKAFYAVWLRLPYFQDKRMVGSGVYILSEQGRARFKEFPQIISDDGYVRSLFESGERLTVDTCSFEITAPKTLKNLIKIKTRSRLGNMQVAHIYPHLSIGGENTSSAFIKLMITKPWLIPAGFIYVFVQWITKIRAAKKLSEDDTKTWERDNSSRV